MRIHGILSGVLRHYLRFTRLSPIGHVLLLILAFVPGITFLYLLPSLLAGHPYDISPLLLARNVSGAGLFSLTDALGRFLSVEGIRSLGSISAADGRLSALLFSELAWWIAWKDLTGWAAISALLTALALVPWWFAVRRLADVRMAWIATVLLALLPLTWKQALILENYHAAVLFLFLSIASFVCLSPRRPRAGLILSGIFFGLSVAFKDVFLIFVPWFVCGYVWDQTQFAHTERIRSSRWKRALLSVLLFAVASGSMYLIPYAGDIRAFGYPVNQNLARVWPGADAIGNEIYLHLYPDPYTYFYDRERFERDTVTSLADLTPLERLQKEKILLNFGLGRQSALRSLGNGLWLFLGTLPSFFQQATVGGVVLWLFLIPGFLAVWKKQRRLAIHALGLIASAFFIISFVLHFSREHLMDVSWILAFFAAVGIANVSDRLAYAWKKISPATFSSVITVVVALHLLQVNRIETARLFRSSIVPRTVVVASAIEALPQDAVVALPGHANLAQQYALFSDRSVALFQEETIERLLNEGKLREAFATYGVTHAALYPGDLGRRMREAAPGIRILPADNIREGASPPPSTFLRWLLHVIR